jgi:L-alanine-DL-glutamate epimerase-like enolase superfamily enzyme
MQITKAEVTPVQLKLRHPVQLAGRERIDHITAIFVRLETRSGLNAWGCAVTHPSLTAVTNQPGEKLADVLRACRACAEMAPSLHPTDLEYSLAKLSCQVGDAPTAMCAFDLAFHDLLSLAAGMPLYRLLGGYRNRIQTSVTVPIAPLQESVEMAQECAGRGFRMLKIKGGCDPDLDVQRVKAIRRALPDHILRLDADGGYTVQEALDVTRALESDLEMIEQPTPADDLAGLRRVTEFSPLPVLADQSVAGPASALQVAAGRHADGISVKLAACGGLRNARMIEAIARAAHLSMMVSCVIEPALLTAAGLSLALSSPNIQYGDLDGYMDLLNDPSQPGFHLEDGWLIATDVPGLGYTVALG